MENFDVSLFVRALGLSCVLEGIIWAAFPRATHRAMADLVMQGEGALRALGLFSLAVGIGLCALVSF